MFNAMLTLTYLDNKRLKHESMNATLNAHPRQEYDKMNMDHSHPKAGTLKMLLNSHWINLSH